jgi:hypothetical protein
MITKAGLLYIRPHNLRHTGATLLLLEGVQPQVVSNMLGHSSVAYTPTAYGHVFNEMRKPARDAMERLFGGNGAETKNRLCVSHTKAEFKGQVGQESRRRPAGVEHAARCPGSSKDV